MFLEASNIVGYILLGLVLLLLIYLATRIFIVQQATCVVVERLGSFNRVCNNGVHITLPFIDRKVKAISLKEQVIDFPPQPVITKDNVTIQVDTVVYFQVTDPKLYTYGVQNPLFALENITATTLRNIIGTLDLDESLTSRDIINSQMRSILDETSDPWGVKVNRVELKNILPPNDIQQAMEKQMRAEREKRQEILIAEGSKQAAITKAEGEKQSQILKAEGSRQAAIEHAKGQAESIRLVNEAQAAGLKFIKDVQVDQGVINLKSLETFAKVADGKANKVIIPSDISNMVGLFTAVAESVKADAPSDQPKE